MPSISPDGRSRRLKQDLLDMKALSEKCPAIKFRVLDDGDAPEEYEVSFYLKTIIGEIKGKPVYRDANLPTIVLIDLRKYPYGRIKAQCMTKPPPYHPNWYEFGLWDQITGNSRVSDTLAELVIRMAKTIQFVPAVTNSSSASNVAAADWWKKHLKSRYFPCDNTVILDYYNDIHKPITIKRKDDVNA